MLLRSLLAITAVAIFASELRADDAVSTVTIDFTNRRPFEGWGTSLCWWANRVGDWPEDRLDALLALIADPKDGLGYSIFRYNIGGGDAPGHHHMRPGANIPGFKAGADQACDWNADRDQRRVLLKLRDRVPDAIFEAFSNSPPYWMTESGCAAGAMLGGGNLRTDQEQAFADYLTEIVKHYRDEHKLVFRTLSPLNEPNSHWWLAGHDQEGCHVSISQQERLIKAVAEALKQKGLTATGVAAPETNDLDDCLKNLKAYDRSTLAAISQINTHTYYGKRRKALETFARRAGKRLWQSESGPLELRGKSSLEVYLAMADRIVADLNALKASAWLDWQVIDSGDWTCIEVNHEDHTFRKSAKFPFYAIFTRFIRPGDQLINLDHSHVLAAMSETRHDLHVLVVNSSRKSRTYRLALDGVKGLAKEGRLMRTSESESLVDVGAVSVRDTKMELACPAGSVTAVSILCGAE